MRVSVICVADRPERLPLLVWSLIAQTHRDWELLLLDQSEEGTVARHLRSTLRDPRIYLRGVPRRGDWGYREKARAAEDLATGDALLFPADDAYYTPVALATLGDALEAGTDLALCGWISPVTGHPMPPVARVGCVDVGGFLVRRSIFLEHGWPDESQTADGQFVERLVASGVRVALCPRILYVPN